jgi:Uma2 family endonuclease
MDQLQEPIHAEQEQVGQQPNSEQRIPMAYSEFLKSFDDSVHVEWTNGEAIIFVPPSLRHQDIVAFLLALIDGFVKTFDLGKVWSAPCEMRLSVTGSSREPDIMFLAKANFARQSENRVNGPADLVIEIISNESVSRDRSDKFYEYQANGVREYWIIDPRSGVARADFWVLDDHGDYRPVPVEPNGIYHSSVLPNSNLNVTALLTDESLDHIQTLIEMVGLEVIRKRRGSSVP